MPNSNEVLGIHGEPQSALCVLPREKTDSPHFPEFLMYFLTREGFSLLSLCKGPLHDIKFAAWFSLPGL